MECLNTTNIRGSTLRNSFFASTTTFQNDSVIAMPSENTLKEQFHQLNLSTNVARSMEQLRLLYPTATSNKNRPKNRWPDILPEERTRVHLKSKKEEDDYINANYISGEEYSSISYISCQAPLPNTMCDFWQMVWEQKTSVICMLTRLAECSRPKADVYWPEKQGDSLVFGCIQVRFLSVEAINFITIRKLEISCLLESDAPKRVVTQMQYTEWPDYGVPDKPDTIINLLFLAEAEFQNALEKQNLSGPWIVHCSAGIGRSGTFVAIHKSWQQIQQGKKLEELNLVHIVTNMRKQRMGMVQTQEQFLFAFKTVQELYKKRSPSLRTSAVIGKNDKNNNNNNNNSDSSGHGNQSSLSSSPASSADSSPYSSFFQKNDDLIMGSQLPSEDSQMDMPQDDSDSSNNNNNNNNNNNQEKNFSLTKTLNKFLPNNNNNNNTNNEALKEKKRKKSFCWMFYSNSN